MASGAASSASSTPLISQLLGKLKPPLILTDTAWIPKFRQTCFPPDLIPSPHQEQAAASSRSDTAFASASKAPQPTSWQDHLSSAPKESFTSSFANLLSSRPSLVFFGEQHHQPHVIRAQIQLLAALADQRDELDKDSSQAPHADKRTVHHLHLLMEHFSYADQPLLDRFHAGTLSISELCSAYRERSNEGFKIEMYAPLLLLARERGATIWGGFPPRTWAREMVKEGVEKVKGLEQQRKSDTQADPTRRPLVTARVGEEVTRDEKASAGTIGPPQPSPLPFLPAPGRLSLPTFMSWDRVQQLSSSHRTFLSSLMRPDGPPRFPSTPSPGVPLGAISALRLYPTQELQGPKAESKGFSPAQALKDSYLAHAASSLVEEGHLLARTTSDSIRDQSSSAQAEDAEVEHRNIVLVVAGLGHIEAGFGAPERLAQSVPGPDAPADKSGGQRPLIILSKPKDSSLWLGPEWVDPASTQLLTPRTGEMQAITPEWLKQQVLAPSAGQVAGHAGAVGTFEGPNGEALVAKKSIKSEAQFYEDLNSPEPLANESQQASSRRQSFAQRFTPKYYGSFSLSDDTASKETSVVCEDLLAGYRRPNVMDIKLGTQLWDEDSSEEKRRRMDKVSRETTSGSTGVRLTGWRTWDPINQEYHIVPKVFGKSIKPEQLSLGMRAFFGQLQSNSKASKAGTGAENQAQAFEQIMKECGLPGPPSVPSSAPQTGEERQPLSTSNGSDTPSTAPYRHSAPHLSTPLVQILLAEHLLPPLQELTSAFSQLNLRMRGGSLLVVWEGDETRLEELMRLKRGSTAEAGGGGGASPQPISLHLIDFAHSRFVSPGASGFAGSSGAVDSNENSGTASDSGPDQGVLKGLRTVRSLVEEIVASTGNVDVYAGTSASTSPDDTGAGASTSTTPKATVDHGWDRKLADALVLYDWVDIDEGIPPAAPAAAGASPASISRYVT
ncbi:SAICAR synthase-like protein [Microstroma glucosiphilum]|uniref:Kinase n=1 Tax=Pseudomicrostroma glucosiphilum TaxID=1684307 RepID=A0A316U7X3_9BASI|nr:SAICAR synthase-like protein [Pseudomicrostroma glucosiphilum]PWN20551.1 SAICAR synthase-like protein [Pseudomicrostroma glucosiphilum]